MGLFSVSLSLLAIATSVACMVLLFRGYAQRGLRLLLWSGLCFVGLSINNVFLFVDLIVPDFDFRPLRIASALVGMLFMLYGFIWDAE